MNRKSITDFAHAAIEDAKSEKVIGGHKIKFDKHHAAHHWAHWHHHHGHSAHFHHFHGHGHGHGHGHAWHWHC